MESSTLITEFIEQIWNNRTFGKLDTYLHSDYKDYSLPATFPTDKEGTKKWILATGVSFDHNTVIDEQVTEGNSSILKIKLTLKHIGTWREIKPTGIELQIVGYRHFKIKDGKIIGHWGLIDGQSIENRLKNTNHGCKITE
ncbi:MAG: ester cyclase [Ferruginibacter sp.]